MTIIAFAVFVIYHQVQEMSLNYHTKCEQWVHFASGTFFNFNGTAGVWRCAAILDAGGWLSRTTVEDMDLSLRAFLRGWEAIYLEGLTCLNEASRPTQAARISTARIIASLLYPII